MNFKQHGQFVMRIYSTAKCLPAPHERRIYTRSGSRTPAQLDWSDHSVVVDVLDIGSGGAGCELISDVRPQIDDHVRLILLDRTPVDAVVRWVSCSKVGVEFDCNLLSASDHLNYEHLGGQYFSLLFKLQSQRQKQKVLALPSFKG